MPSWQKVARRIRVPLGFLFAAAYIWLAHPTVRIHHRRQLAFR